MKFIVAVTCLLAATTAVRGLDQDAVIAKYMEYLMPNVQPCADEFHMTEDQAKNIQQAADGMDLKQLGCLKGCVMKRMGMLTGNNEFHLEPVYTMIESVHAGNDAEIQDVKKIAEECITSIQGEPDECNIGTIYSDCYIQKLFN
ncbi:odorant binding protein 2 [Osmia lignaria lignaria]|uniref:odorant binding protein 2 n=1 Tax=Osmia lignaria lignaria TaxID=1437193 RepID=UPI0014781244|nr:uncharacterized protein LOC117606202 [Osmia lignaria]